MRERSSRLAIGFIAVLSLVGCGAEPDREPPQRQSAARADSKDQDRAHVEQELRNVHAEILDRVDSVEQVLSAVPRLTGPERRRLRRDLNAEQIARARALGVRASDSSEVGQLRDAGQLVPLEDSTRYWVVRKLEHSMPYVTPDAEAMLTDIGRRFHAQLDSLGLPPYRMEITSVLRTPKTQAQLRQSNANASQGVSAHEFGTTLDISRIGFSAPAGSELQAQVASAPSLTPQVRQMEASALARAAEHQASALQAALGRVLVQMREENKLLVMMERRQAVYHITVAKRFPAREGAA